ncbi:hypothetical protein [Streptomyces sp. NPDC000351]|uniref:hypothetical protein n=1 Tax=Streptomyces sp. NPDC000351 TaxID=3154250 RepID=UPI00332AF70E
MPDGVGHVPASGRRARHLFERGHTAPAYASSPELLDTRGRSLGTGVAYGLGRLGTDEPYSMALPWGQGVYSAHE